MLRRKERSGKAPPKSKHVMLRLNGIQLKGLVMVLTAMRLNEAITPADYRETMAKCWKALATLKRREARHA